MAAQGQKLNTELLRKRLKLKSFASEKKFLTAHTGAARFFEQKKLKPGKIREHAAKLLTSGVLAGSLLLSASPLITNSQTVVAPRPTEPQVLQQGLARELQSILPATGVWQLNREQEEKIQKLIEKNYGIRVTPELDGNRLNNSYGRMGAEQHLARFPGDVAENMAPGLGGWGYVNDPEVEKYYVAVQTLYLSDWREKLKYYVDWYRFRKMVVVNPANGKTMVAAVADAGPAWWTGKHFGGSPEVMEYLGINYGPQNHPVVLFFLDDKENKIPLGPVGYNIEKQI